MELGPRHLHVLVDSKFAPNLQSVEVVIIGNILVLHMHVKWKTTKLPLVIYFATNYLIMHLDFLQFIFL